ncbi:MAG TPA: hypothetical protein VGG04_19840 [Candidatus Sulfotelmatobacter sp.]
MRRPSAPGTPIDARRFKRWTDRFGSYRDGINNLSIESWLDQFEVRDRDLAARVLDVVEYFGQGQIYKAFQQALSALPGWHVERSQRQGNWRFAAMSGSAGESGDAMLHHFRVANRLDSKRYSDLFVDRSVLFRQAMLPENDSTRIGAGDAVVLLDDFSGTGQQVCDAWNSPETSFGALLADVGSVYLVLVAATEDARIRISKETSISLVHAHELHKSDNVFANQCTHFSGADRAKLLRYGQIADRKHPKGRGECGLVVVFQHRPPNNSIPILHAVKSRWAGLFPRHG